VDPRNYIYPAEAFDSGGNFAGGDSEKRLQGPLPRGILVLKPNIKRRTEKFSRDFEESGKGGNNAVY